MLLASTLPSTTDYPHCSRYCQLYTLLIVPPHAQRFPRRSFVLWVKRYTFHHDSACRGFRGSFHTLFPNFISLSGTVVLYILKLLYFCSTGDQRYRPFGQHIGSVYRFSHSLDTGRLATSPSVSNRISSSPKNVVLDYKNVVIQNTFNDHFRSSAKLYPNLCLSIADDCCFQDNLNIDLLYCYQKSISLRLERPPCSRPAHLLNLCVRQYGSLGSDLVTRGTRSLMRLNYNNRYLR
ncbi:hypothetical protein GALMADRAFT_1278374 [Galerina marginata CBS 339.88]|uniref:Uncharacterized protein n=1 Tax=Galerina marginata (strain CBS 339.88) TaxID=685588 RepID=A0A067TG75_GALM3|nr:hypothetical protein GALMADRAFT_1278374 [Galerina marginata CBS 339.88]